MFHRLFVSGKGGGRREIPTEATIPDSKTCGLSVLICQETEFEVWVVGEKRALERQERHRGTLALQLNLQSICEYTHIGM